MEAYNNTYLIDLEHSMQARPAINKVYGEIWDRWDKITRADNNLFADQFYHVDVILESTKCPICKIVVQEKALRAEFAHYNCLTMEYMQDRRSGECGEFFNLCAQYYFSGYINDDYSGFIKYRVINIPVFMAMFAELKIKFDIKPTKGSHASFICFNYDDLPECCVIAKKG